MWAATDLQLSADKIQFLADFDGNKYIDLLVSRGDDLYAFTQFSSNNKVTFQSSKLDMSIKDVVKIYVTSLNADGYPDMALISPKTIQFYKGQEGNKYSQFDGKSLTTSSSNVYIRDINYDGISDILVINDSSIDIYISKKEATTPDYNKVTLDVKAKTILFLDADGDCITDLLVMDTSSNYIVYSINHGNSFTASQFSDVYTQIYKSSVPSFCGFIGVGDFDRNGSLDILYDDCTKLQLLKNGIGDSTTCGKQTPSFTTTSIKIQGTDSTLKQSNQVCFGDLNSDSFLDIIYLGTNNKLYSLTNLKGLVFNHEQLTLDSDRLIQQFSCFDYNHNGFFNLAVVSSNQLFVLQNQDQNHNYFLKLSGLIDCNDCAVDLPPATHSNFKFYLSDEYGDKHGMALSHSNIHLSLSYQWIGLGSITNYIPTLSMATFKIISQDGIIPNSHLYFFNDAIQLYMKMGDAFIVIAVLVASSVILLGLIIWLHRRETREDIRLTMMSANRVLLRGL